MQRVYLLFYINYATDDLRGVFSTKELAEKALEEICTEYATLYKLDFYINEEIVDSYLYRNGT